MNKIPPPNNNNNKKNKYSFFAGGAESRNSDFGFPGIAEDYALPGDKALWQKNPDIPMQPESLAEPIPLDLIDEAPAEWNFFPVPDTDTLRSLARSIYSQGQLSPCIAWERDGGRYMMLGGHTRMKTLKFLAESFPEERERFSTVVCHVYGKDQISEAEARFIIISSNMTQRAKESAALRIRSVCEAMELQKSLIAKKWGEKAEHSREVLAKSFNTSPRSIDRLYSLRKLIPGLIAKMEEGMLPARTALALAKLPGHLQEEFLRSEMYKIKIRPNSLKALSEAATAEEMRAAACSETYSATAAIYSPSPIPKNFRKIGMAIDPDDYGKLRAAMAKLLESIDFASADSKRAIQSAFDLH